MRARRHQLSNGCCRFVTSAFEIGRVLGIAGTLVAAILRPWAKRAGANLPRPVSGDNPDRRYAVFDPVDQGRQHVESFEASVGAVGHAQDAVEAAGVEVRIDPIVPLHIIQRVEHRIPGIAGAMIEDDLAAFPVETAARPSE
jgi:hypothetical protein